MGEHNSLPNPFKKMDDHCRSTPMTKPGDFPSRPAKTSPRSWAFLPDQPWPRWPALWTPLDPRNMWKKTFETWWIYRIYMIYIWFIYDLYGIYMIYMVYIYMIYMWFFIGWTSMKCGNTCGKNGWKKAGDIRVKFWRWKTRRCWSST